MRRLIVLTLILLFVMIPLVQAQDSELDLPVLADGDVIQNSFEDEITSHLYAFYGTAGDSITITMTQESDDLDPFLILLNSDGAVLDYDDDDGATALASAIEDVTLEEDGVYFVFATSFYFVDGLETSTDDELTYTLSISGQSTPENIEDDEIVALNIQTLSIGDSIAGDSTDDNPAALFFLEASAGDVVTVSLEDADFFTMLHFFAPDGARLGVDPSWVQSELEEDGIYIIIATDQFFYEVVDDNGLFEGGSFILVIE